MKTRFKKNKTNTSKNKTKKIFKKCQNNYMISNITIILTTSVNVSKKKINWLFQTNKQERLTVYLKSIKKWLLNTSFNIVVIENTGYKFKELNKYLKKYKDRFEIITFDEQNKEAEYLKTIKDKGAHELFSINYAYNNSNLINKSIFIIKITGRYFVPELQNFLCNFNMNDYDALTQYNNFRCEIVGSHIKHFHDIFNKYLVNKNTEINEENNGNAEHVFQFRISLYKNVIKCPVFKIDPTKRGGVLEINYDL